MKADHIVVPEGELLDAIYLTPDYGFALACGARPEGVTDIDDDHKAITFENPKLFDPEERVYVYEIDTDKIPEGHIRKIDDRQYAIVDFGEIDIEEKHVHKAGDIQGFYELKNWKEKPTEMNAELK